MLENRVIAEPSRSILVLLKDKCLKHHLDSQFHLKKKGSDQYIIIEYVPGKM